MYVSRRQTLFASAALATALVLPRLAGRHRKFIFVYASGGWDPTRALADGFDHPGVAMEARAERASVGGLPFVDHPERRSVRAFFQAHAARSVVVQGVLVRSIAHEVCTRLATTGTACGGADWASRIQRGSGKGVGTVHRGDLSDPAAVVEALARSGNRCATLQAGKGPDGWDSHHRNDERQSPLWESLFAGLLGLQHRLEATPGTTAPTLAGETVVVVISELGRTPGLNAQNGKDHWPYTSALLVGDGIAGGRAVGGWDRNWYGQSHEGQEVSVESLGATLLALADLDPRACGSDAQPIHAVMA